MANEWLAEGFLQLRLGAAWGAYAGALALPDGEPPDKGASRPLLEGLRRQVLEPFLMVEWLPGIREAAGQLEQDTAPSPDAIRTAFLRLWPGDPPAPGKEDDPDRVSRALRRLLLSSLDAARSQKAEGAVPFPAGAYPSEPVLEPLAAEEMALAWVSQARALCAWPALAAEAAEMHRRSARQRRWAELREACGRARQELGEAQHRQSRLQVLLGSAQLARALGEASAVLVRCHEQLAELADGCLPSSTNGTAAARDRRADLEQTIQALLDEAPRGWLPWVLAELQQCLGRLDRERYGGLLARMVPPRAPVAVWGEWDRFLRNALSALSATARARLLLLRTLIAALDGPFPPAEAWDHLEGAARSLFRGEGLEAELIHDADRQKAEWFVTVVDPSLERPRLGRVGLAVRVAGGAWVCFPPGEQRHPAPPPPEPAPVPVRPRTPEECALAELDALVKEAEAAAVACPASAPDNGEPAAETPVTFHNLDRQQAQTLEGKWKQWQEQWRPSGLEAEPAPWTFLRPVLWNELALAEEDLSLVFRGNIPRGVVFRVKAFGLRRRGGELIRQCTVYVSAGLSPAGFSELYRLVEKPAHPGEEELRHSLRAWPAACLHDALGVVAVRLFVDFWGSAGEEMRLHRGDEARRFGEQLAVLLRQELGLETFYPETYQEYPDGWLLLHSDQGAVTGRVHAVIRPGLKDEQGNLHVPAIVDVD